MALTDIIGGLFNIGSGEPKVSTGSRGFDLLPGIDNRQRSGTATLVQGGASAPPASNAVQSNSTKPAMAPKVQSPLSVGQRLKMFFGQEGISGALADVGMALSADAPNSWQHQLGKLVSIKATADVMDKYARNLEEILGGADIAPTQGLSDLEKARIPADAQLQGLETLMARRKLGLEERQVGAAESQASTARVEAESRIPYYSGLADFYEARADEIRDGTVDAQLTMVPAGDGVERLASVDKKTGNIIAYIGQPAKSTKGDQRRTLLAQQRPFYNTIRSDAARFLQNNPKYGQLVKDDVTGQLRMQWSSPEAAEQYRKDYEALVREKVDDAVAVGLLSREYLDFVGIDTNIDTGVGTGGGADTDDKEAEARRLMGLE